MLMRIAQVSPLWESVPPKFYGGTERIISYLTEEFFKQRHEVTLCASGDSVTSAQLIAPVEQALRLDQDCTNPFAHHVLLMETVLKEVVNLDSIHYHIDYLQLRMLRIQHPRNTHSLSITSFLQ
jgi:hypothetical protein